MILKLNLSNDIEHSHNMANMYRVPVLKDQGVDGCLSVWLRWHPLAHVVHERLDNRVILVSHLQRICFSQPTRNEKETSALQEDNRDTLSREARWKPCLVGSLSHGLLE